MRQITRIGLDIAKRWFQVHAVDCDGHEILNRKLPRDKVLGFLGALPACEVALEACSSSHFWEQLPRHGPVGVLKSCCTISAAHIRPWAIEPRPPMRPTFPQHAIGCATPTSSADRTLLHPRPTA